MSEAFVEARFSYLDPGMDRKPVAYTYAPPAGTPQDSTRTVRHVQRVYDARSVDEPLSLDVQGVEVVPFETKLDDAYHDAQVREVYYPECQALVARVTGAERVLAFDHNVRNEQRALAGEKGIQRPVRFVHNDYTEDSAPRRVRDLLPGDDAERRLQRRFAVINVWRPIVGPVLENPLGVCDARSMRPKDFVETDLRYRDRTGHVYSVAHSPEHRWLYVPRMRADEALLLKCYDSATDGRARYTAHSAFRDPNSPADAPARQSIEVRTLAFF